MMNKVLFIVCFMLSFLSQIAFAKNTFELQPFPVKNGNGVSGALDARLGIKFLMGNITRFSDFGIESIELCAVNKQCEEITLDDGSTKERITNQLHYVVTHIPPGIYDGFLMLKRQNTFMGKFYLDTYQVHFPEPLFLDSGVRYELVIDLERVSEKYYKPYYISFDRVVPVGSQVAVVSSDRDCTLSAPHAGFDVVVPQGAMSHNTIIGIEYDRSGLNTGMLKISPDKALSLPATIFITFDQPELLYGDESVLYSVTYNASEVDLDYHGQGQNGRPVYMLKVKETGVLSITEKNPFEKTRFRPITDIGHRPF